MVGFKLMYRKQFEVLTISMIIRDEVYRTDLGLSPVGAFLSEFDREYFGGTCDVNIILKNGNVITKKFSNSADLKYPRFHRDIIDLQDPKYQIFLDQLDLNLSKRKIRKMKRQICLPS